jgi:penicillin G amidase
MKTIKRLLKGILVLIILLVISLYFYLQHIKPKYKGELTLSPLENKVEVWFDSYGIPHIYAENKNDLYMAMGYLHAQERLFQMELVRRIAPGRLSEILGKDLLPTDKFFRTLGIHLSSQEAAQKLRTETNNPTLKEAEAYLRGINEFLEKGPTPLEYELLSIEKTPFTLEDIYNAVGYMSFSFAAAHKTDPLVSFINAELGASYLKDLGLEADTTRQMIPSYFGDPIGLNERSSAKLLEMLNQLPVSPFIGSNGWVLGPSKTKSGKVLFANDPHIGFSQPSVWYEAYLETPVSFMVTTWLAIPSQFWDTIGR